MLSNRESGFVAEGVGATPECGKPFTLTRDDGTTTTTTIVAESRFEQYAGQPLVIRFKTIAGRWWDLTEIRLVERTEGDSDE